MEITLKNIGIIENSTIKIDGLTVIAGYNNSGKTTIGKVAYSLFEATSKIDEKINKDKNAFLINKKMEINFYLIRIKKELIKLNLIKGINNNLFNYDELFDYSIQLIPHLNDIKEYINSSELSKKAIFLKKYINELLSILNFIKQNENIEERIDDYVKQSIKYTFLTEFSNQITPFKTPSISSAITISKDCNEACNITLKSNTFTSIKNATNLINTFSNIFFIDDPFILDEPLKETFHPMINTENIIVDMERFISHRKNLLSTLRAKTESTILESLLNQDNYHNTIKKIKEVLPGNFNFSDDEDLYIEEGFKLKFANLATGSKLFAILKILIEKNKINDKTLLILDEPEAHLHPEWQIILAELLAIFVKEIGVKIILTTHSPNFLLAIETHMLTYELSKQTNYYVTEENKNKFINYKLVNNDLSEIYSRFISPFSKMKELRDNYLYRSKQIKND